MQNSSRRSRVGIDSRMGRGFLGAFDVRHGDDFWRRVLVIDCRHERHARRIMVWLAIIDERRNGARQMSKRLTGRTAAQPGHGGGEQR